MKLLEVFFNNCAKNDDVVITDVYFNDVKYKLVYVIEMVDIRKFNYEIKPFINSNNINNLNSELLGLCNIVTDISCDNLEYLLYSGKILLFYENIYYSFELTNRPKRAISKSSIDPDEESNSQDGLIEDFNTNITLIKRRIKSNKLIINKEKIGELTKTDYGVLYLNDKCNKNILKYVNNVLDLNKNNEVISINDITNMFQDNELIPKTVITSSPNIICSSLIKGKIVIIIDNSPIACIIDATLFNFTFSKSYIESPKYFNIFNHFFIIVFLIISLFSMGLFIAIINYHPSIIPLPFLANIKITERGTSWSMFIEVIIVYFLFEFYRFATSRSVNNYIQNIIIILGGLFIGQNAIESGTIGGTILFLTSISYIAVFAVTNNTYLITSINIFRFFILLMSYFLGILGFIISSFIVMFYLFKQNNNSNYYLYPIIPFNFKAFKAYLNPKNKYKD